MQNFPLKRLVLFIVVILVAILAFLGHYPNSKLDAQGTDPDTPLDGPMTDAMRRFLENQGPPLENVTSTSATACVGGMAGIYPCQNIDLLAQIALSDMAATAGNDSWGWTDPLDGKEYALMGLNNGTAFVDITDPENPVYLGKLPTHTVSSTWRDIKVYADHAFIVSEASGHGMQVFDLTRLRNVTNPPVTFTEDDHYNQFGNAHNIAINEDSGFAYAVGTSTCSGGLHMVNIQNPTNPTNAGCFSADGYTHDTQCVIYTGPDTSYQGHEICFSSNEDSVTIVDVTNKATPVQIFRFTYSGTGYTHQGWLTEDQRYFLFDDELDEQSFGHNTRTRVVNVTDLNAPVLVGFYDGPVQAIDHNLYTKGSYAYEANYRSGLRMVNITNVSSANLSQAGYFDTYPASNTASFSGAWSTFPYFGSGVVIISDINSGLFIVQPWYMVSLSADVTSQIAATGETVTYTVEIHNQGTHTDTYALTATGNVWNTAVSTNTVSLAARESTTFTVAVDIPPVVTEDTDNVIITAVSQTDNNFHDALTLQTNATYYGLAMTPVTSGLAGLPGQTVTYTLDLTNLGNLSDTYDLSINGQTWATTLSTNSITLDAGQSESATVQVTIPPEATVGDNDIVTVTAVSQGDNAITASANLTTTVGVTYGIAATAAITEQSGLPGSTLTYTLQITNTGNTTDTFDVQTFSEWSAQSSPITITLASGADATAVITVTIPLTATANSSESIIVTATSQADHSVSQQVVLTAVALAAPPEPAYMLYLPLILRP
jgi:choice-of-anchor B domain-containing protein